MTMSKMSMFLRCDVLAVVDCEVVEMTDATVDAVTLDAP